APPGPAPFWGGWSGSRCTGAWGSFSVSAAFAASGSLPCLFCGPVSPGGGFGLGGGRLGLVLLLAVVAALGPEVAVVAGQAGAQARVLAVAAEGQAQLAVRHGQPAGAGLAGQQLHLEHLGGAEGGSDEGGGVLAPLDDVDLLAVEMLHHGGHTVAPGADAGRDGVDVGVAGGHRHFGAGAGLAADGDRKSVV